MHAQLPSSCALLKILLPSLSLYFFSFFYVCIIMCSEFINHLRQITTDQLFKHRCVFFFFSFFLICIFVYILTRSKRPCFIYFFIIYCGTKRVRIFIFLFYYSLCIFQYAICDNVLLKQCSNYLSCV